MKEQLYFFFDQTRCMGCETCCIACKDWNDVPAGPAAWRRVSTIEEGKYPDVFVAFLSTSCHHCENPSCISACPAEAIYKRDQDGIVLVEKEKCLGKDQCGACTDACPYAAPQFGAEENALMQKCDFCLARWAQGKKPICVDACPTRALDAGPFHEIKRIHGGSPEATGFSCDTATVPSILFKPKKG